MVGFSFTGMTRLGWYLLSEYYIERKGERWDRDCNPWLLDYVLGAVCYIPRRHYPDFPVFWTICNMSGSPFPVVTAIMVSMGVMLPMFPVMMAIITFTFISPIIVSKSRCGTEYYGKG